MKKILILLSILIVTCEVFAQPINRRSNASHTVSDARHQSELNLFTPRYADTTAANVEKGIDSCGAIIYTYDVQGLWNRKCTSIGKKWERVGSTGASSLQEVTTIGKTTTDTVRMQGIRTNMVLPDTITENSFKIIIHPDLQYMTQLYPTVLKTMFTWLVDSAAIKNVKAVVGVGDMTQSGNDAQFRIIDTQYRRLDTIGLPYVVIPGNHDYDGNAPAARPRTLWDTYFPESRWAADYTAGVRGSYNGSTMNNWYKFDVGSKKFLVLGLEFFAPDTAYTWAMNVLDSFYASEPDRDVMITTHGYITAWGDVGTDTSSVGTGVYPGLVGNDGDDMWERIVRNYPSIKWVVSGHARTSGAQTEGNVIRYTDVGRAGNVIHQFLFNYQQDSPSGGNGYFVIMDFNPNTAKVECSFYSNHLNQFDAMFPAFTIDMNPLRINNTVGIGGELQVNGDTRLDSNVYIKDLYKQGILFADIYQGKVKNSQNFKYNEVTNAMTLTTGKIAIGITNPTATFEIIKDGLNGTAGVVVDTLAGIVIRNRTASTVGQTVQYPAGIYFVGSGLQAGTTSRRTGMWMGSRPTIGTSDAANRFHVDFFEEVAGVWRNTFAVSNIGTIDLRARTSTSTFNFRNSSDVAEGAIAFQHSFAQMVVDAPLIRFQQGGNFWGYAGSGGLQSSYGGTFGTVGRNASAILEAASTTQGFLQPRMTAAQRLAIASPAIGLSVFDTDTLKPGWYDGIAWRFPVGTHESGGGSNIYNTDGTLLANRTVTGNDFYLRITGGRFQKGLGTSTAAANDLTLPLNGNMIPVTGNTQINAITTASWQAGSEVTMIFTGTPTLKHNTAGGGGTAPLALAGGTDFVADNGTVVEFKYDGTVWHEVGRKMAGKGGRYQFENGLSEGVGNKAILGGTLNQNTTINSNTFNLSIVGNSGGGVANLSVTNTGGSGVGISASGSNYGITGETTGGYGVRGAATTGIGIYGQVTSGRTAGSLLSIHSSTNDVSDVLVIDRATSGTAANGIGTGVLLKANTDDGFSYNLAKIQGYWENVVTASRTGGIKLQTTNAGTTADALDLKGDKSLVLYGRALNKQGADVASVAGAIAVGFDGNSFELTGTNAVTSLSNVGWQNGSEVTFIFTSTASLVDGTANSGTDIGFELPGNTNFTGSAGTMITLKLSEVGGTQRWRAKSYSVN